MMRPATGNIQMKKLSAFLLATSIAGLMSTPSLAEDKMMDMTTMTCGDLMKMDKDGMMSAASHAGIMMQMDAMSDADKKAMEDKMATETAGMSDADKKSHMMMAMQTDMKTKMDAMTDDEKAAQMKTDTDMMTKMETACKDKDDMMVTDVMKSTM